jgi:phosphoglycerol transferase MdoB-like AlkP superfamily enzyme
MSDESSAVSGGASIVGLLGVAFVVLKLCNVIDWSWWWVTLPFWGGPAIVLAIVIVILLVVAFVEIKRSIRKRRR